MKSRPFFFFKRIRFFLIAVPVLVAAVLLVDVAGRPSRIDLDEVISTAGTRSIPLRSGKGNYLRRRKAWNVRWERKRAGSPF